jgi:hypothetical protein
MVVWYGEVVARTSTKYCKLRSIKTTAMDEAAE